MSPLPISPSKGDDLPEENENTDLYPQEEQDKDSSPSNKTLDDLDFSAFELPEELTEEAEAPVLEPFPEQEDEDLEGSDYSEDFPVKVGDSLSSEPVFTPDAPTIPTIPTKTSLPTSPNVGKGGLGTGSGLPTMPRQGENGNGITRPASRGYQSVGKLTAEEILNNDFSKWEHLEGIVLEHAEGVQKYITENNQADAIGEARAERGEKFEEMVKFLDRLILGRLAKHRTIDNRDRPYIVARVTNEILGLGPIEPLWQDKGITEIIADGPDKIYIERNGQLVQVPGAKFRDAEHLLNLCGQILAPLNRSLNNANPLEDGRLPDKSRVNAVHPVIAPGGPLLTIRRHREEAWTMKELVERESMNEEIAKEIGWLVHSGCSTIVIGGTGTGKMLSHDTLLPTPNGFITMGEAKVGDEILEENGKSARITAKYSNKKPVPYQLTFSDGTQVLADEEHNWLTSTRSARRSIVQAERTEEFRVRQERMSDEERTILEIKRKVAKANPEELVSRKHILDLFPDKSSMITSFFSNNSQALLLQVVLEDNTPGRVRYMYPIKGILDALYMYGRTYVRDQRHMRNQESVVTTKEIFNTLKASTGHTNHAVSVIQSPVEYAEREEAEYSSFRAGTALATSCEEDEELLEVLSDSNSDFHIPDEYRFGSIVQRREFITGFLEKVGSFTKDSGVIKVSHPNVNVLRQVSSMVSSLGENPLFRENKNNNGAYFSFNPVTYNPFNNTTREVEYKEVYPSFEERESFSSRTKWRYITNVEPVEDNVEMSCITVDSPSSLYLCTENFIVTHNTTVLNAISGLIPEAERSVTIEDNLELQLHPDRMVAALEARPPGANQRGEISIRDLVRNALRMRPDRIIVGEVRDSAAFDMLQAMNTGHDGSLTTFHANGAEEAVERLESMVQMAGELDPRGVKALIASAVDVIVVASRYEDGSRRVSGVYEMPNRISVEDSGNQALHPIPLIQFIHDETTDAGKVIGHYERVNHVSEGLIRKHRLQRKPRLDIETIYEIGRLHDNDEVEEEESVSSK